MRKVDKLRKLIKIYGLRCVLKTRVERYSYKLLKNYPDLCDRILEKRFVKNEQHILQYVPNLIPDFVDCNYTENKITTNCPIWIFWWTGFETAPDIVKKCVSSVEANRGNHPLILLSKENIQQYVELPIYIWEKFEKGIISVTHLSDIIRVTLLYTHGGIWADATLFMTGEFDSQMYSCVFYSNKRKKAENDCVSKARWSTFFLAGGEKCPVFKFWKDFYFEYWKNSNHLQDYLLMDYALDIGYRNVPIIKELVDAVPCNNEKIKVLYTYMNKPYKEEQYRKIIAETSVHKLSWKDCYLTQAEGKPTVYATLFQ